MSNQIRAIQRATQVLAECPFDSGICQRLQQSQGKLMWFCCDNFVGLEEHGTHLEVICSYGETNEESAVRSLRPENNQAVSVPAM